VIAIITLSLYAIRVAQDRSSGEPANQSEGHLPS